MVIVKAVPEQWGRPVVDTVLLPAHAQTSFQATCTEGGFTQTQGYNIATGESISDQAFVYDLGGATPCGDGTVTISNLAGDLDDIEEQWTIWLGAIGSGVNLGLTQNSPGDCEPAPGSVFPVTQAQLQAAISSGTIQISAENGSIDNFCDTNTMDVTLSFAAD